jgi:two-component system, LytTR family, sensor kinase
LQNQQTERQLKQMEIERDSLARATVELKKEQAFSRAIQEKNRTVTVLIAFLALGLLFAWALWTRMLFFKRKTLDMQIRSEAMEKQRLLNEIALLKTQVNPHFLFNSLSILSSLVHQNAELSEQFIEQLARSYRYILEQKDQVLVSLRTELEFIQAYAFLLQIRFDHKFELDVALPENIIDRYKIAPLTLQLLVENAVKHNRMSAKEPLRVRVRVDEKYLEIRNVLRPRGERIRSTGIGLQNIINRYALLCDEPVWAGEQEGDFLVKVPLIEH